MIIKKLKKEEITSVFENSKHQFEYLIGLYKLIVPDFESVRRIDGFPVISVKTNEFITMLAVNFDKEHHPGVFAGGLWLNRGFSTSDIPDWEFRLNKSHIIKGEVNV